MAKNHSPHQRNRFCAFWPEPCIAFSTIKRFLYILVLLLTISSCYRSVFTGPYGEKKSNCGKLVLKPRGKAILTKCGEIMWKEEGNWTRQNDTIKVQFRNQWDNKVFVVKKRNLLRVVIDSIVTKPSNKIKIER